MHTHLAVIEVIFLQKCKHRAHSKMMPIKQILRQARLVLSLQKLSLHIRLSSGAIIGPLSHHFGKSTFFHMQDDDAGCIKVAFMAGLLH
jgi:hypothetical protein